MDKQAKIKLAKFEVQKYLSSSEISEGERVKITTFIGEEVAFADESFTVSECADRGFMRAYHYLSLLKARK